MDDAYAQKPIEVRVKGKTWVNRWPYAASSEGAGVNVTMDKTGLITLTGTASADVYISIGNALGAAANKSYTLAVSNLPSGVSVLADSYGSENTWLSSITVQSGTTATGTTHADMEELRCMIKITNGTTVNASFRVMLVEGVTAPDCFVPTGLHSVEPTKLVTAGKNLLRLVPDIAPLTANGIAFTPQDDGGILVNGTATDTICYNLDFAYSDGLVTTNTITPCLNGQTVTCSGHSGDVSLIVDCFTDIASQRYVYVCNKQTPTGMIPQGGQAFRSFLSVDSGATVNTVVYPQLELGSTATAYEPPNVTETALPEVELRGMPDGTCDELVINADGTCEVERKIAKETFGEGLPVESGKVTATDTFQYLMIMPNKKPIDADATFICDRFNVGQRLPNNVYVAGGDNAGFFFTFPLGTFSDKSEIYAWFAANPTTVVYRPKEEQSTEPQSPVTLPFLPAPTFNQYHDGDVPSDTSTTYARDINIALANLEAQIADLVTKEAANV